MEFAKTDVKRRARQRSSYMSAHSVACACGRVALTIFLLDDDDVDGTAECSRIDRIPGIRNCAAKIANVIHGGNRPRVGGAQQGVSKNRTVAGGRGKGRPVAREDEGSDWG